MGIYVSNMKMPKTCAGCDFVEPIGLICTRMYKFLDREDYMYERDKNCPLFEVEVSEYGRLIDVKELSPVQPESCERCKHRSGGDRFWICPKCKRQYEDKYEPEIRNNKEVNTNEKSYKE